jgi:hypothetical protein
MIRRISGAGAGAGAAADVCLLGSFSTPLLP